MSISVCSYHPEHGYSFAEGLAALQQGDPETRVWIDVETKDSDILAAVAAHFQLHELTVEDCLSPGHFPKLEDFGSHIFIILRGVKPQLTYEQAAGDEPLEKDEQEALGEDEEGKRLTYKVVLFLGPRFLITVRRQSVSWLDALVRQAGNTPEALFKENVDVLAHRIIDVLIDRFARSLGIFDRVIDRLEEEILERPQSLCMSKLFELRRKLSSLRLIMRDQRGILAQLANEGHLIRERHQRRYFKDIDDHAVAILNMLDKQIDEVVTLREAYFAQINLRLGDIMRILAVIAAVTAPLNLVVGLYGMNFDVIPLLHNPLGFWLVVSSMALLTCLMLIYFRKKRWL